MINRLEQIFAEADFQLKLPPSPSRKPALNGGQWLGLIGVALLFVGVWLPVFDRGRDLTLWDLDQDIGGWPLFAPVLIALAGVAIVAVLRRWSLVLGLVGLAAYALLAMAWMVMESALYATPPIIGVGPRTPATFALGWVLLMLGAMLLLAAAAIGEYLSHRDRKPSPIDLHFEFPALAQRHSLATLQSGWELRN